MPVGRRAPHRIRGGGAAGRHRRDEPAALAAQRQLLDRRPARRRQPHDHRLGSHHLAQHHRTRPHPSCSSTCTGTRGATTARPGCAKRASARRAISANPREGDCGRIDVTSIRLLVQGAAPSDLTASKRFIAPDDGNADDETVMAVPLPERGAAGRHDRRRGEMDGARAPHLRAHRRDRQLLLHRAVVPEARRAAGRGMELPSVPLRHRVLLRLRRLRRVADGAEGMGRRRDRRPSANAATTPTARRPQRYYQEDVHDFAWTTSPDFIERTARFEHAEPAAGRDAAAAAARARGAGRAPLRRDAHDAQVLRRVVRRLSRTATSRSSIPRTRAARAAWSTRRSSPPARGGWSSRTSSTPEGVTVHEAGHQFWYGIVGNNEFEDAWMDEGFNTFSTARAIAQVYDPNYLSLRYFGGFVPWVFPDIALSARDRRQPARRLPRGGEERRGVHAVLPVLPGDRRRHHVQQDGALAEHARALARVAGACSGSWRRISRAGSSGIPTPDDFFAGGQRGRPART